MFPMARLSVTPWGPADSPVHTVVWDVTVELSFSATSPRANNSATRAVGPQPTPVTYCDVGYRVSPPVVSQDGPFNPAHFLVVVAGALLLSLNIVVVLRYSRTFALLRAYALVAKHFIKTARLYAKESKTWSPPAVTTQASVATDAVCFTAQLFLDMRSVANMALGVPPTPKPVGEISQPGALTPLLIFQKLYSKQETPPQFFITSTSTGGSKMSDAEDGNEYRPRVAQSIAEPPPTTLSPVETHDANEWDDDGAITESYGTEAGEESTTDESLETLGRDEYEKHIHSMGTHEQTDEHSES